MLKRTLALTLLLMAVFALSNCATTPRQKRISENPDIFSQLNQDHQGLVQQGQIKQGMNKKAVYLAWGNPSRSSKGAHNGTNFEKWYYYRYNTAYPGSIYSGYGYNQGCHYGNSISHASDYSSELEAKVEFRQGIVYNWENAR